MLLYLLMDAIVWLFDIFVLAVVLSLFVEIVMPGEFKTLHKIYKIILEFDDEEEL